MILSCDTCTIAMELRESIEGGGDSIERYVCPKCGKESYLGKFTFRPLMRQSDASASRPGIFYCKQCDIRTAGIVLDVKSECRWCPICRAPLFQYEGCERERLEKKGKFCRTCLALNVVREAKPTIDQHSSDPPRGGAWNA